MLIRQKIVLALLSNIKQPLSRTVFVKLVFLMRYETSLVEEKTFYDFVPYKYGPFSFTLYHELVNLRQNGYLIPEDEKIGLSENSELALGKIKELPLNLRLSANEVVRRFGKLEHDDLIRDVYKRYPWYAIKSEWSDLRPPPSSKHLETRSAVYTAGYEGKSVETFFNLLLKEGIELLLDIRANPISRRYGYSKNQFSEIATRLGINYIHLPEFGIPRSERNGLTDYNSYQHLMNRYEHQTLPNLKEDVIRIGDVIRSTPAVLVCFERDANCCHRSRLAKSISEKTGLEVVNL